LKVKKICFITSTRADYGLLRNLMLEFKKDSSINLNVVVTGSHLIKKYGFTINEILNDGFSIIETFKFPSSSNIAKIDSSCIINFHNIFIKLNPDLIFILGDRHEILSAAISANLCNIPLAHSHGGELTPNCYDDAFRHCITKLSSIHFVANSIFQRRVIQMGENPKYVFNVGGLGVDAITKLNLKTKQKLAHDLKIDFCRHNLIITYHPVTLNKKLTLDELNCIIRAIKKLNDTFIIFTSPNIDNFSDVIINTINKFVKNYKNSIFIKSLGQINYYSLLKVVDGVIGNSSSGLLEVPSFKKGTINIGIRQKGRPMASSVINIENVTTLKIYNAINKLFSESFRKNLNKTINPYGKSGSSKKIYKIIKNINLNKINVKKFYDI